MHLAMLTARMLVVLLNEILKIFIIILQKMSDFLRNLERSFYL